MKTSSFPVITRRDLINQISYRTGLTQAQISDVLQLFTGSITGHLASSRGVVVRNFGVFEGRITGARAGDDPWRPEKDGVVPAGPVVTFTPGKAMRERILRLSPPPGGGGGVPVRK